MRLGVPEIETHLPDSGLARGALHEIVGAAAALFAAILARAKGQFCGCLRRATCSRPGSQPQSSTLTA